jgi:hypothetical protein
VDELRWPTPVRPGDSPRLPTRLAAGQIAADRRILLLVAEHTPPENRHSAAAGGTEKWLRIAAFEMLVCPSALCLLSPRQGGSSRYRLRAADATHLATAVSLGADRFITDNQRDFPTTIAEIRITYPADLPDPSA